MQADTNERPYVYGMSIPMFIYWLLVSMYVTFMKCLFPVLIVHALHRIKNEYTVTRCRRIVSMSNTALLSSCSFVNIEMENKKDALHRRFGNDCEVINPQCICGRTLVFNSYRGFVFNFNETYLAVTNIDTITEFVFHISNTFVVTSSNSVKGLEVLYGKNYTETIAGTTYTIIPMSDLFDFCKQCPYFYNSMFRMHISYDHAVTEDDDVWIIRKPAITNHKHYSVEKICPVTRIPTNIKMMGLYFMKNGQLIQPTNIKIKTSTNIDITDQFQHDAAKLVKFGFVDNKPIYTSNADSFNQDNFPVVYESHDFDECFRFIVTEEN